jgi:phage gp29-like protein
MAAVDAMKRAEVIVDPSRIVGGWLFYPYNPSALVTRKGLQIFDTMKKDEQVKACLAFKKAAMLTAGWEIVSPGDEDSEWEVTQLVRDNFNHFPDGWNKALKKIMTAYDYGYSCTEKIFGNPLWDESKLVLTRLSSVKPHYLDFQAKSTGELLSIVQHYVPGSSKGQNIPVDKMVVYSHDMEFENHYGRSELESAYRPWWVKENTYKWLAIYLERYGMAPLFALYNPNAYQPEQLTELKKIVRNMQNATMGVIPRGQKDDLELFSQQVSAQSREIFLAALSRFDADIGRALLTPSLIGATSDSSSKGGDQAKGSYARSKTHFDLFLLVIEEQKKLLAAVINEQIVKQLCDLNFPGLTTYPEFTFLPIEDDDEMALYETWSALVSGKVVNRIPDDETHIRKALGFPENEDPVVEPLPVDKPSPGFDEEGNPKPKPMPIDADTGKTYVPPPKEVPEKEQTKEMQAYAEEHDGVWVQYGADVVCVPAAEYHPPGGHGHDQQSPHAGEGGGRWVSKTGLVDSDKTPPKSTKHLVRVAMQEIEGLDSLEVHRGNGYYYATGKFTGGDEFVTEGISVNRMSHLNMYRWISSLHDVINNERGKA